MTLEDITKAVELIRTEQDDYPSAHIDEDELYTAFIQHVADTGPEELALMAKAVLTTQAITFPRWCA